MTIQYQSKFNPADQFERRIQALEGQLRNLNNVLNGFFVKGRLRKDRTVPSASNDVQTPDQLYDRVVSTTYEYILVNNSGTLEWIRITCATF